MRPPHARAAGVIVAMLWCCSCSSDPALTFARLLERAASWGASIEFALQLAAGGLVPRAYIDDLMESASAELTTLTEQLQKAEGVDDIARRDALASCSGLAAIAGDAARAHGTPTQSSIRELEIQLRAMAQHARGADGRR
jgi:hypothetical protein